jgi:hypothetical protein
MDEWNEWPPRHGRYFQKLSSDMETARLQRILDRACQSSERARRVARIWGSLSDPLAALTQQWVWKPGKKELAARTRAIAAYGFTALGTPVLSGYVAKCTTALLKGPEGVRFLSAYASLTSGGESTFAIQKFSDVLERRVLEQGRYVSVPWRRLPGEAQAQIDRLTYGESLVAFEQSPRDAALAVEAEAREVQKIADLAAVANEPVKVRDRLTGRVSVELNHLGLAAYLVVEGQREVERLRPALVTESRFSVAR